MTQITINIEKPGVLPILKKMIGLMDGVSISKANKKATKPRLQKALDAAHSGQNYRTNDIDELMEHLTK